MALRYGSKSASALRYNSFSASALRYGSKIGWTSGGATSDKYFTYTLLDDDTYSIKAADVNNLPANLVIPSSYNGKPVTQIGDSCHLNMDDIPEADLNCAFSSLTENVANLLTVTIPNTITKISDLAFYNQQNLQSVTFQEGSNLTHIGVMSFGTCKSLLGITLPDTLTSIGESAFSYIDHLEQVIIPASIVTMGATVFNLGYKYTLILCEAESKPDGWNDMWEGIGKYIEPIWNCNNFNFVLDTSTDTYIIGVVDPSKLTGEFYVPPMYNGKVVDTISSFARSRVTAIYYPASITRIFPSAFDGCTSLVKFSRYKIESQGSSSIQEIGETAFRNCSALTSIYIPITTTNIGNQAFKGCSSLLINCAASSKPDGWASDWNPDNRPVTWGY